ncbi:TetR/AcrR family transcriptional regulator [Aeromicrobium sp.]|uniref:TetR/AcrR family transcriptional regulator n=1 Tax=Aeromicrobium sp. TaxID=1871063 RepID=UPI002620BB16|nr:TetR/AcrR family transcriptional regulator [Aeromicrobium sp.]
MVEVKRSYGGVSAADRSAGRRAKLLEATIAVLADGGETRTTMTAICARAGLTERYFYESFASRDEAVLAALDAVAVEIASVAVQAVADTGGDPADRVRAALSAVVSLVASQPDKGRVAVVESSATPELRARRHALLGSFAELVAHEAAALFGDAAWPEDRARVHGLVYAAGVAELVAAWVVGDVELEQDELVAAATDLFVAVARRH